MLPKPLITSNVHSATETDKSATDARFLRAAAKHQQDRNLLKRKKYMQNFSGETCNKKYHLEEMFEMRGQY
jgi:hypothetical protein